MYNVQPGNFFCTMMIAKLYYLSWLECLCKRKVHIMSILGLQWCQRSLPLFPWKRAALVSTNSSPCTNQIIHQWRGPALPNSNSQRKPLSFRQPLPQWMVLRKPTVWEHCTAMLSIVHKWTILPTLHTFLSLSLFLSTIPYTLHNPHAKFNSLIGSGFQFLLDYWVLDFRH